MKRDIILKNVEFPYKLYFDEARIKCPCCESRSTRTRTYKSLKQLVFHLSDQHKNEGDFYPFKLEDIHALMDSIALAKQWKLLA